MRRNNELLEEILRHLTDPVRQFDQLDMDFFGAKLLTLLTNSFPSAAGSSWPRSTASALACAWQAKRL